MTHTINELNEVLHFFDLNTKREVEKCYRGLTIRSGIFVKIILAARMQKLGEYKYACHFSEYCPEHLIPTEQDRQALHNNGVGVMNRRARKVSRKIFQVFKDRRNFAAHLFFTSSKSYWHLFYFDQRDADGGNNHWKHGPHIHYSRESFINRPLETVWNNVKKKPQTLLKTIHIKYSYHHNKHDFDETYAS